MERKQTWLFLSILLLFLCSCCSCCNAMESPQYRVVHSESDVEIRLYRQSSWVSALVRGVTSFEKATKDGFHRLYQYLHGSNLNSSQFKMTAPILTSITPSANGSDYFVRFYLSSKYEEAPPQPYPELNLLFDTWTSHCVAVRKFSGFAKDDNIDKEKEALVITLEKILTGNTDNMNDKNSYTIAQYNASHHVSGRLNEVWMNFSGFAAEGCPSY